MGYSSTSLTSIESPGGVLLKQTAENQGIKRKYKEANSQIENVGNFTGKITQFQQQIIFKRGGGGAIIK